LTKVDLVEGFLRWVPIKDRETVRELRFVWMALLFVAALVAVCGAGILVSGWLGMGQ